MITRYGLLLLFLILPVGSMAQSNVIVEGLQQPAWVQRGQARLSLYPGQVLGSGDRILTGQTGKAVLRMSEGSRVKLGVNVDFRFEKLEPKPATDTFTGFLRVLGGAFRFITAKAAKMQARDIQIALGTTATIGIRGTDVWGKVSEQRDFVVLLEGGIEINRQGKEKLLINKPMTIFDAPRGAPAKPLTMVDPVKLQQWALETELDQNQGVLTENGVYIVYLYSSTKRQYAEKLSISLQKQGYAADIYDTEVNHTQYYRVGIAGFASRKDANHFMQLARNMLGITDAWFAKRPF